MKKININLHKIFTSKLVCLRYRRRPRSSRGTRIIKRRGKGSLACDNSAWNLLRPGSRTKTKIYHLPESPWIQLTGHSYLLSHKLFRLLIVGEEKLFSTVRLGIWRLSLWAHPPNNTSNNKCSAKNITRRSRKKKHSHTSRITWAKIMIRLSVFTKICSKSLKIPSTTLSHKSEST